MWDDGNTIGDWVSPFPMLTGWILLGATFLVAVALLAWYVLGASKPTDDGGDE